VPSETEQQSSTAGGKLDSWKRQESTFCILHLIVLAVLLLVHTLFSSCPAQLSFY
jgi:hypothetical protein